MSKSQIAVVLYRMKKTGESIMEIAGEILSADELLTMFYGREISEIEGQKFISK